MTKSSVSSWWPWLVLLGCIGCYSIPVGMIGNTAGLFVAPVMDQFGWDQTSTTMYRTIQPLVAAVCTPIAGRMFARYSPRVILTITSLVFGLSSAATAYATQLWQWNLYGVIYGVTCAFFMYLAAPVLVNRWFHKSNGLALGITAAVLSILAAFTSPITQALISSHDWQYSRLVICLVATVASVVLTVLFVRDSPDKMGLKPYGADEALGADAPSDAVRGGEGATRAQALASPGLYLVILIAAIIVMTAAFFQQVPAYTAKSPLGAGAGAMAVSIVMIGGTIGKLVLGWLADRIGVKPTSIAAMLCGALGMSMAFVATDVWLFYVGMVVFGVGYAGLTVIVPLLVRNSFGSLNYADIYSWVSTGIFLATSLSFLIYGRIVDLTGSFAWCFYLVIALYLLAAVLIVPAVNLSRGSWVPKDRDLTTKVGV
jgi:Arabinose efflux permease